MKSLNYNKFNISIGMLLIFFALPFVLPEIAKSSPSELREIVDLIYGSHPRQGIYEDRADLNDDGRINIADRNLFIDIAESENPHFTDLKFHAEEFDRDDMRNSYIDINGDGKITNFDLEILDALREDNAALQPATSPKPPTSK